MVFLASYKISDIGPEAIFPGSVDVLTRDALNMMWWNPAEYKTVHQVESTFRCIVETVFKTKPDRSAKMEDQVAPENLGKMFGPNQADHLVRQAMEMCWMMLPKECRNSAEVEKQIRRLVERAIRDMKEDAQSFGME